MSWWTGIDWGSVSAGIGDLLRGSAKDREIEQNAAVARFNRVVDRSNLAIFRQRMIESKKVYDSMLNGNRERIRAFTHNLDGTPGGIFQYYTTEAAFHATRSSTESWLAANKAAEIRQMSGADNLQRLAEIDRERTRITEADKIFDRQIQRLETQAIVSTRRRDNTLRLLDSQDRHYLQQRQVGWDVSHAETSRIAASRARIDAERRALGTSPDTDLIDLEDKYRQATRTRIGAEREALVTTAGIRRTARIEEAYGEAGAGVADVAGRGIRGSGTQAAEADAVKGLRRDLAIQEAETTVQALRLTEDLARVMSGSRRISADLSVAEAKLREREEMLKVDEQENLGSRALATTQYGVRYDEKTLRAQEATGRYALETRDRNVEYAEIRGDRAVRRKEETVLDRQQSREATRHRFSEQRAQREEKVGAINVASASLAAARSQQSRQEENAKYYEAYGDRIRLLGERWQVQAGRALSNWQLNTMPNLPNYENLQTRNALATLLNMYGRSF